MVNSLKIPQKKKSYITLLKCQTFFVEYMLAKFNRNINLSFCNWDGDRLHIKSRNKDIDKIIFSREFSFKMQKTTNLSKKKIAIKENLFVFSDINS